LLRASKKNIIDAYRPVFIKPGVLDTEKTARRISGWSKEFFGDPALESTGHYHIQTDVPPFHEDIYCDLMSNYRLYYITAPSEFAKTTICTLVYPLYQIVYFKEPFTVLSGRVDDTSVGFLDLMKGEIEDNQKFTSVYGYLRTPKSMWNDHHIILRDGQRVTAIPFCGNVRSRRKGQYRITLFIGDDPEELTDLNSKGKVQENFTWLNRTVEKRLDRRFGKLRLVGTRIGADCTIARVMKDSRWRGKTYTALVADKATGKEESIWPTWWSTSFLKKERDDAILNNDLDSWMFERMNEPIEGMQKNLRGYKFHELEYMRGLEQNILITPGLPQIDPIPVFVCLFIDPAYSQNQHTADQRALIVTALGQQAMRNKWTDEVFMFNSIWVLEYIYNFMDPASVLDKVFIFHKQYYLDFVVMEAIGGAQIYESFMDRRLQQDDFYFKYPFTPTFVKHQPANKLSRVYNGLNPKVKLGQLFVRERHLELRREMDLFQEDQLHLCDALELGLRNVPTKALEINKVSSERKRIARESFARLTNQAVKGSVRPAIPTNLGQIMGRRYAA